ncbi:MAG: polysaccharide deacetylase family protein [Cyclobacteriaceae bacterium]
MNQPVFIISLDFELHWGRFDKEPLQGKEAYYRQTLKVIPLLLSLFKEYDIAVTWATVGMLMADDEKEWADFSPRNEPVYSKSRYSAYEWYREVKGDPNCLFAPDAIREILSTPGQELGSHTFAHYYTRENGQQAETFKADLMAAKKIAAQKFGQELNSLVFPRNQYDEEALKISKEAGFSSVRTNPKDWYWKFPEDGKFIKRFFRTGDALFYLGTKKSFSHENLLTGNPPFPVLIPASRFLRPFLPKLGVFNELKIERVKRELQVAATSGEIYHLWWHPHNHGWYPGQSMLEVRRILEHFCKLREQFGMESHSMGSLTNALPVSHKK